MSARHKRSRQAASTQTDESGSMSATNSPRLSGYHGESGATANTSSDSPRLSRSTDSASTSQGSTHSSQVASNGPTDFYEEQSTLYERLVKAEEVGTT